MALHALVYLLIGILSLFIHMWADDELIDGPSAAAIVIFIWPPLLISFMVLFVGAAISELVRRVR